MNIYLKNVTVALILLLFCFLSLRNLASALETSTQLGGNTNDSPDGAVASEIANCSQVAGLETFDWFGSQTTIDNIYSAASGVDQNAQSSVVFYIGEGDGSYMFHGVIYDKQYYIYDDNLPNQNDPAFDYNIAPRSSSCVDFVFLWSCFQGAEIGGRHDDGYVYGMPYSWLGGSVTSTDGYNYPDASNKCFIGFNETAPQLEFMSYGGNESDFIMNFYMAAVCCGKYYSLNAALDYASFTTFGAPSFAQTLLYEGDTYDI